MPEKLSDNIGCSPMPIIVIVISDSKLNFLIDKVFSFAILSNIKIINKVFNKLVKLLNFLFSFLKFFGIFLNGI